MTDHFAEQDQGILPATPNTGVCFSGDRRPETDGSGLPGGYCHPKPFTSPFDHLIDGTPKDGVWINAIGQIYFQPFGLYNADNPTYFSFNEATVSDIKHRYPALAKASFHTVRTAEPRPYLIINGTMIGPTALSPFHTEPVVNIQYTPIYVGVPHAMQVTYHAVERRANALDRRRFCRTICVRKSSVRRSASEQPGQPAYATPSVDTGGR
jgi:hypothetical protein